MGHILPARHKGQRHAIIGTGWHAEAFARSGKSLKPLDYYLHPPRKQAGRNESRVVAMFKRLQAGGAAIEIRER